MTGLSQPGSDCAPEIMEAKTRQPGLTARLLELPVHITRNKWRVAGSYKRHTRKYSFTVAFSLSRLYVVLFMAQILMRLPFLDYSHRSCLEITFSHCILSTSFTQTCVDCNDHHIDKLPVAMEPT